MVNKQWLMMVNGSLNNGLLCLTVVVSGSVGSSIVIPEKIGVVKAKYQTLELLTVLGFNDSMLTMMTQRSRWFTVVA